MKPPYARPGETGLYCGDCGESMLYARASDMHDTPHIWRCQGCKQSWHVGVAPVTNAKAMR